MARPRNPSRGGEDEPTQPAAAPSRASRAWTGLVVSLVLIVVIAIFVIQNTDRATINFLAWHAHLPVAAALLLSLVLGAAVTLAVGAARIRELRHRLRRR